MDQCLGVLINDGINSFIHDTKGKEHPGYSNVLSSSNENLYSIALGVVKSSFALFASLTVLQQWDLLVPSAISMGIEPIVGGQGLSIIIFFWVLGLFVLILFICFLQGLVRVCIAILSFVIVVLLRGFIQGLFMCPLAPCNLVVNLLMLWGKIGEPCPVYIYQSRSMASHSLTMVFSSQVPWFQYPAPSRSFAMKGCIRGNDPLL